LSENSEKVGAQKSRSGEPTGQGAIMAKSGCRDFVVRGIIAVQVVACPSSEASSSAWLSKNLRGVNEFSEKPSKRLSDGLRMTGSSSEYVGKILPKIPSSLPKKSDSWL
jgi:hypothetical protein